MITIWALFDSGNGCYRKTVDKYFKEEIEIYSIGIDIENKNNHFLHLDLANYKELFNNNDLFDNLDKLPKPQIILASPPCESWSNASAMKDGNASWYTETMENLFGEMKLKNNFTIRTKKQIEDHNKNTSFKKHWWKTFFSRINGELCTFNTLRIIERYKPKVWVIENPQTSKIWDYIEYIHGFKGIKNIANYSAYNDNFSKKPTIFYSNVYIPLKTTNEKSKVVLRNDKGDTRKSINGYNERSNIPIELIRDLLNTCIKEIEKKEGSNENKTISKR